jgi:hypothetical protein
VADPYATRTPDLSGRPTGPPPYEESVLAAGGGLVGAGGLIDAEAAFLVVPCRGMGTLAPLVRVEPALATLLYIEHSGEPPTADRANRLLAALRAADVPVYAIKQGCVGGPGDRPGCFPIEVTLIERVLAAAVAGDVAWERDPDFGYDVPGAVPGLESDDARALLPRLLYADHDRVYEHASLVATKKRERAELAGSIAGLDPAVAEAAGWPPVAGPTDWRS